MNHHDLSRLRSFDPVEVAKIEQVAAGGAFEDLFEEILLERQADSAASSPRQPIKLSRSRRSRRRRRAVSLIPALVAAAVVLVVLLPSGSGPASDTSLGLEVDMHLVVPTAQPARFTANAITLGYVPTGFHLTRSSRVTDANDALNSQQYVDYSGPNGARLEIQITPAETSQFARGVPAPRTQHPIHTTVNGHAAVMTSQSATRNATQPGLCGAKPKTAAGVDDATFLQWFAPSSAKGVGYDLFVTTDGASFSGQRSMIEAVARSIIVNTDRWSCWAIGGKYHLLKQIKTNGGCTPGEDDSPAYGPPLLNGRTIASGALYGARWTFQVSNGTCGNTGSGAANGIAYGLAGANGTSCGGSESGSVQSTTVDIDVSNLANGHRIACGVVPTQITKVTVTTANGGRGVTEPVLAQRAFGHAFFVLSLGRTNEGCYYLCTNGNLTFHLFKGSALVSTYNMNGDSIGGEGGSYQIQGLGKTSS